MKNQESQKVGFKCKKILHANIKQLFLSCKIHKIIPEENNKENLKDHLNMVKLLLYAYNEQEVLIHYD
jgi:hypothetical protein